jgi:hypothetical protein
MANIKGHLILNIEEASGRNKENNFVWDFNEFAGWVKGKHRRSCSTAQRLAH